MNGIVCIPSPERLAGHNSGPYGRPDGLSTCRPFVLGPEMCLAEPAVRSLLGGRPSPYNPLLVSGPSGCGKSHLVRAIAAGWKATYHRSRVLCTTAAAFARELEEALEIDAVEDLRDRYRTADLVVFEDVAALAGSQPAQQELIHTLDALLGQGSQVLATATSTPARLAGLLPALQGRLASGLTIRLLPPGRDARLAMLRQLAALNELDLPDAVADLLAAASTIAAGELEATLTRLARQAESAGQPISVAAVHRYLARRHTPRRTTLQAIAAETARLFLVSLSDLRGPARRRLIVTARGVAMYLARQLTHGTLQQIGQYFGGRDHTTVMHACRRTKALLKTDPTIRQAVHHLQQKWHDSKTARRPPHTGV